ncbi:hypothetical protein CLOACE_09420 [Clostridium acetireducens DSM 10703]|uniref:CxxH/CxxC protein n=1 Tax=Clostridium acetireducens DSM 10703 TaxID=1121290 RepID=A0A1E8EZP4_9CLOT|nr:CxxH/CxxC protein [Clostridium acetireducens]OFI06600.1 hypothetical protein CLOACE_09420 [Clostridium acetireducens DSM 10703]
MLNNKYCCEKHKNKAFDDFLKEHDTFPYIEKVSSGKCNYCDDDASFVLKITKQMGPSELLDL